MPRVSRYEPVAGRFSPSPTAGKNARGAHTPQPTCMPRVGKYQPVAGHRWPAPTAGRNGRFAYTPEPSCMPRIGRLEPVSRRLVTPLLPRVTKLEPQAGRWAMGPVSARRRDG
jgi:hypothetical protein